MSTEPGESDPPPLPTPGAAALPPVSLPLLRAEPLLPAERALNEAQYRARTGCVYLGDHTVLCRVLGRYKVFVDTRDIGLASHLMLDGYWEMWVTEVLSALVKPGMVVADIGANVGYYALLMAELVGPAGRVFAFEPNPRLHGLMTNSLAVNGMGHAVIHRIALSDCAGEVMLVVPPGEPKNGFIAPVADPVPANAAVVGSVRLDANPDWAGIELAKIDVEGSEEKIWAGMAGLLATKTLKTVVLEFTPERYRDPRAFLQALTAPGFSLARIDVDRGTVACDADAVLSGHPQDDVMLVLQR
ncbi:FkbM family methyltransferase [Novosphingobium sp.]|uniref:FkbM family methyltransferase n=1 Tax=Novosphingobium sp. TaxID=1874826 RepID=UPI00334012F8